MNVLAILGAISFVLGVILLLPPMRRRAKERGLKGVYLVPLGHVIIGFAVFLIGMWSHANPP